MKTTRRNFIKLSAGAFSITMLAPRLGLSRPMPRATNPERRILVVVQLNGGNDGFNTVIPYADARYHSLRPNIGFDESELRDADGNSTIINDQFAFHPAMKELKSLYGAGKLAVVLGVGYPNPDLSHALSTDIWQTANGDGSGLGWLGRYADSALTGISPLPAATIGISYAPKIVSAAKVAIPLIGKVGESAFRTIQVFDRDVLIQTFRDLNQRNFATGSTLATVAGIGSGAERNSGLLNQAITSYHSSVVYNEDNPAAQALKAVAILASVFPESTLFHVAYLSAFDTHAHQIGSAADQYTNKLTGTHATDLQRLSEGIKAFQDDMTEQGLADNTVLMTYSEFGRRPNENASNGTDHGTASSLFVVGNAVKGGDIYGLQPSLNAADLDSAGHAKFTSDFRSVYATLLDKWMPGGDSQQILGGSFAPLGFL